MKASEKRLAMVFALLVAVIGGLVLVQKLKSWQISLKLREEAAALEKIGNDELLADSEEWRARNTWLKENQPQAKSDLEADSELMNTLLSQAQKAGVTVLNKQFLEAVKGEFYDQHGVTLTVKGDVPGVFRWIYSVQSPTNFRVVPSLKITPDKDDPAKVTCAVQFWCWYQPLLSKAP